MCVCACTCLITMLIVANCASVGCFQCPLFGLPDRTLLSGRAREGERPLNNVLIGSFSQHSELCSGYRDSCLIYSPKGTAGDHAAFVCGLQRCFPSPRRSYKMRPFTRIWFATRRFPCSVVTRKTTLTTIFFKFFTKANVMNFNFMCQVPRLRHSGVSGRWDLPG